MRSKSLVSMGLASVLIAPSVLSAANPQMVQATSSSKNVATTQPEIQMVSKKISSKARAVIKKIRAVNPKKSNYIAKTKSAKNAYNKLSKKDKKMVTNYSTLKKHWSKIQPSLKKVDKLKKSVSTLNTKNFTTKASSVKKQYDRLNTITKAAVPRATVKKLNYYADVNDTHKLMPLSTATIKDGVKIYDFISSYKKLSGAQKTLLKDLLNDEGNKKLKSYLDLEEIVKVAANIEKKFAALKPTSNTFAKDAVSVYKEYATVLKEEEKKQNGEEKATEYMPNKGKIANIYNIYKNEIDVAEAFSNAVNNVDDGSVEDSKIVKTIEDLVKTYTSISKRKTITVPTNNYAKVAPIDLVDKKVIATYKKYESIPGIIDGLNNAKLSPLETVGWVGSGNTNLLSASQISSISNLLAQYKKLGANQKTIVQNVVSNVLRAYLSEVQNVANAQVIDKSYATALKKKTNPNYFSDLKKVYDSYIDAPNDVKRFVANATAIYGIPTSNNYAAAKKEADEFTTAVNNLSENSTLTNVNAVIGKYKIMAAKVPTSLTLVDKTVLKTYSQYAGIPDLVKLIGKIPNKTLNNSTYGYSTKNITTILTAIKSYKKLGEGQKTIIDNSTKTHTPTIEDLTDDESNIKAAQSIDKAYAKLKKSSKSYPKDAKKVYTLYDDASADTIKYLVNANKIVGLQNAYKTEQGIATTFEKMVNKLNKKSKVEDVEAVVRYYLSNIKVSSKVSDLVDNKVMKEYKQYAPISDVMQMFDLIRVTNPNDISPTNIKYIRNVIKAYNKLGNDQQAIVDGSDRTKFNYLKDADEIAQAETIDKAFEKIKPTDKLYELEVLKVYHILYDRAPSTVKKYVVNKAELETVGTRYLAHLKTVREFETMVRDLWEISQKGYTPGLLEVKKVKDYYENNVKYNIINAKYNVALETLIDPDIMKQYRKFENILKIQDIAKSIYVQYGRFFNGKGFTVDGDKNSSVIYITNKNDINSILKAIELFNDLDSIQRAIVDKAPRYMNDHTYEIEHHMPYDPNKQFTENEIIRPSIPLHDDEVKYFLAAQEIDKAYEALKPSSSSYAQDCVSLYYKYINAGPYVQAYVMHSKEILAFATTFKAQELKDEVDNFIKAVNALSKNSTYNNVSQVVDQYHALNEIQLSLLEKPVLTKYNSYALIVDIKMKINNIIGKDNNYTKSDITLMLDTIAIYKKLSKDPKFIVDHDNSIKKPFIYEEKDIKAAQKLDKKYETLDESSKTYGVDLKKVLSEFEKLSATTKKYVVNDFENIGKAPAHTDPKKAATEFEEAVNKLNASSTYADVSNVVTMYNELSNKAKSYIDSKVLATYNKYEPIVTIYNLLCKITPIDTSASTLNETYKPTVIDNILNAIKLYNKLGKDQKAIVEGSREVDGKIVNDVTNKLSDKQKALLKDEEHIKAAQALDKKIVAIKPGNSGFVKAVISASKTYDVMKNDQRVYVQNYSMLEKYRGDKNIEAAIKDIADFEKGIAQVEEWSSDLSNDKNATCDGNTCSSAILNKMKDLVDLFEKLNTERLIKGEEMKLATLLDRKALSQYQYYYAVYDLKNELDKM